jgi:hypothetical protein
MKIFGIGLNKTGTTTLGVCLQHFGFRHASSNLELTSCVERGDLEAVFAHADRYDSFEDWPWPLIYRELDGRYPNSKFILTTRRDADVWVRSLKKHATLTGPTEFRRIAYGYPMPHGLEDEHKQVYQRHNAEVREYFRNRPADFLDVCWEDGHGWSEVCTFLGRPVPDKPFPHANRSSNKTARLFWSEARRIVKSLVTGQGSGRSSRPSS